MPKQLYEALLCEKQFRSHISQLQRNRPLMVQPRFTEEYEMREEYKTQPLQFQGIVELTSGQRTCSFVHSKILQKGEVNPGHCL